MTRREAATGSTMILYENRHEASERLVRVLRHYRGARPLVLALPTGAIEIASEVACALDGELDVVLVDLIGAPDWPDYLVGAVDETGWTFRAPGAELVGEDYARFVADAKAHLSALRARRAHLTPDRNALELRERTVIVVDDGSGSWPEIVVALHSARAKAPARLVFATPLAPPEGLAYVGAFVHDVVCLAAPCPFEGVERHYSSFERIDEAGVASILEPIPRVGRVPEIRARAISRGA